MIILINGKCTPAPPVFNVAIHLIFKKSQIFSKARTKHLYFHHHQNDESSASPNDNYFSEL